MTASKWLARSFRKISGRPAPTPAPTLATEAVRAAAAGDAARDRHDWNDAALNYSRALALAAGNTPLRVQLGHALKEAGRWGEAEIAYRAACASRPNDAEIRLHLGHVLKAQRRPDEAIATYVEALQLDPHSKLARNELIAAGGRNFLPASQYGRVAVTENLSRIGSLLEQNLEAVRDWVEVSTFPVEAYDNFRRSFPIQPPPSVNEKHSLVVLVEAMKATAAEVRVTLTSLINQRDTNWKAVVRASSSIREHPVSSFARQDERIVFIDDDIPSVRSALDSDLILMIEAGALMDREAVGWFQYASIRTRAQVIYADHDHHTQDWRYGTTRSSPALQSMPDIRDQETTPAPPISLLVSRAAQAWMLDALCEPTGAEQRRRTLLSALRHGVPTAHLPRILSSLRISDAIDLVGSTEATPKPSYQGDTARILVVIPTRDQPVMLRSCLDSLKMLTAQPDALDILVLNNRTTDAESLKILSERSESGEIEVLSVDEPFNWARFNNISTIKKTHDILVFANNDVEILTNGWDDTIRNGFSDPDIAIIGARLLYPDSTIQHAGVVMGANNGRPVHEGLGALSSMGGPLDRWRRRRQVTAITGALMAVDRAFFEQAGGFNERLAIAYNDIDLCMRARAAGKVVLYEPQLEAIHHESKTRGLNDDPAKVAWDDAELSDLHRVWDDALLFDPGKNPHWTSDRSRVFDGYRDLSLSQVLESLDRSARDNPWTIYKENTSEAGDGQLHLP